MTAPANVLVVDDEEVMRNSCRQILTDIVASVRTAESGAAALLAMREEVFDLVILDLKMPGIGGMEVLKKIKEESPQTIVIVITGYATVDSAVEAMREGAYDFLPKPFTPLEFRTVVNRSLERRQLAAEREYLQSELSARLGMENIVGEGPAIAAVRDLIARVGPTDSTVLVTGESGTGKELVARAIHRSSLRRDKPFVVADCGAFVENLFESELFGHVKGAFTGATETKRGRFETANGGTIFLDEIGNLNLNVQSRLLRVIQEREVTMVGSSRPTKVDVRIVAATNKNLREMVEAGGFREDLFYRVSVVPIDLPSLRERKDDIAMLAGFFLKEYNRKRKRNIEGISSSAMQALIGFDWPGNVRELENAIERAVVLARRRILEPEDLLGLGSWVRGRATGRGQLARIEEEEIRRALVAFGGNRSRAAQYLGIDRKTILRKMKRLGIVK